MTLTIQDKMRCASVAYQQFLVAIKTDQQCLDDAQLVFEQYFGAQLSQCREMLSSEYLKDAKLQKDMLQLQLSIGVFSRQFECLYIDAFKRFKVQFSVLISTDSKEAFRRWLQIFDSEYLQFIRQESVCREYAQILAATAMLGQQLHNSEKVA